MWPRGQIEAVAEQAEQRQLCASKCWEEFDTEDGFDADGCVAHLKACVGWTDECVGGDAAAEARERAQAALQELEQDPTLQRLSDALGLLAQAQVAQSVAAPADPKAARTLKIQNMGTVLSVTVLPSTTISQLLQKLRLEHGVTEGVWLSEPGAVDPLPLDTTVASLHNEAELVCRLSFLKLCSGSLDGTVCARDLAARTVQEPFVHSTDPKGGVQCVAATTDYVYSGSLNHSVMRWSLHSGQGKEIYKATEGVMSVCVTAEDLYIASRDGSLVRFSQATMQAVSQLNAGNGLQGVVVHNSRCYGALYTDRSVVCCDFTLDPPEKDFTEKLDFNAFVVTLNRSWLFCGGGDFNSGAIQKLALDDGRQVSRFEGHKKPVHAMCASATHLFSGSGDKTVRCWDLEGNCLRVLNEHTREVYGLCINSTEIYSAGMDGIICVWQMSDGQKLESIPGTHNRGIRSICMSCDPSLHPYDLTTIVNEAAINKCCIS